MQVSKEHMVNKMNIIISTRHDCNVISNPLGSTKCTKIKMSHYSLILQGCMNTCSGRVKFRDFIILLDSGRSSTIVMGKLKAKFKQKETTITLGESQAGKFFTSNKMNV